MQIAWLDNFSNYSYKSVQISEDGFTVNKLKVEKCHGCCLKLYNYIENFRLFVSIVLNLLSFIEVIIRVL